MPRPLLLALAGTLVGAVVATGALLVAGDAGMAVVWALTALAAALTPVVLHFQSRDDAA